MYVARMSNWSCNHSMLFVVALAAPFVTACEAESSAGSPAACQKIELSIEDAHADAAARSLMTGARDVLRASCTEDRWSARAIACFAATMNHPPGTASDTTRCAAMLTPVQAAHFKRRGEDFIYGPGRTAESVQKDMEAAYAEAVPVPACREIEFSTKDTPSDPIAQLHNNEELEVIRGGCADFHWSAAAIACFKALARNLPASESEREHCLEMLTPPQEAYLKHHGVDLFLSPRRLEEQARKELYGVEGEQDGSAAPPVTAGSAPPAAGLQLTDLVGTWAYRASDRMEGRTDFRIEDNGSFEWTYSPMHDGGCQMHGLPSIQPNSSARFLAGLSVKVSDGNCTDSKVRAWSVRAYDGQKLTLVDPLDKSSSVFRRQ